MFSGTRSKSSISLTGEVIITEGNKVPSAVAGSACAYGVGFLLPKATRFPGTRQQSLIASAGGVLITSASE